jgi:O-antigen ligase
MNIIKKINHFLSTRNFFQVSLSKAGIFFMIAYACYYQFIEKVLDGAKLRLLFIFVIFIFLFRMLKGRNGMRVSSRILKSYALWLILTVLFMLHNEFLEQYGGINAATLRIVASVVMAFVISRYMGWLDSAWKMLIALLSPYCIATYFFFLVPSAYSYMIDFYGYYPAGTSHGTAGYRAGLADHYSQNGIYLSILFMMLVTMWMVQLNDETKKDKRKYLLLAICVVLGSLLLTGKRAVLIVSVAAMFCTYILSERQDVVKKWGRLILALILGVLALYVIMIIDPAFSYVFERFETIGSDGASEERIAMWNLAIELFLQHPIVGIGFYGFRYQYAENLFRSFHSNTVQNQQYMYLNAHNVYLQVLCENGIVGFSIYLIAVLGTLIATIILIRRVAQQIEEPNQKIYLTFSVAMQLYYLVYSLSGNCLYDIVFIYYMIAVAYAVSIRYSLCRRDGRVKKREISSNLNFS